VPEDSSNQPPAGMMRKILPFTSIAVLIALMYVGYIFYSRRSEQKQAEQQASERQAADNRKTIEAYGGEELKILNFYATAGPLHRGEAAQLCYSVSNAQSVKIEPDVHEVPVSYSNCAKIAPKRDTVYTLTATDKKGATQQASLTMHVY
jgi:hypothetical protein